MEKCVALLRTRRECLKSTLCLRLKKRKTFFFEIFSFRKKSRTVPKKIQRGDPLVSSGSVGYVKKVKNERGPFALVLHWSDLALGSFSKSGPISVRSVV